MKTITTTISAIPIATTAMIQFGVICWVGGITISGGGVGSGAGSGGGKKVIDSSGDNYQKANGQVR